MAVIFRCVLCWWFACNKRLLVFSFVEMNFFSLRLQKQDAFRLRSQTPFFALRTVHVPSASRYNCVNKRNVCLSLSWGNFCTCNNISDKNGEATCVYRLNAFVNLRNSTKLFSWLESPSTFCWFTDWIFSTKHCFRCNPNPERTAECPSMFSSGFLALPSFLGHGKWFWFPSFLEEVKLRQWTSCHHQIPVLKTLKQELNLVNRVRTRHFTSPTFFPTLVIFMSVADKSLV